MSAIHEAFRDEVLGVEAKLARAVLSKDRASAEAVLAPDFIATGHAGNVVDRVAYLDIHFSPDRDFVRFDTERQEVREIGDGAAAVLGGITVVNAKLAKNPPPARYLAVYRLTEESWQIVAWQETPIDGTARF